MAAQDTEWLHGLGDRLLAGLVASGAGDPGLWATDAAGRTIWVADSIAASLGEQAAAMIGRPVSDWLSLDLPPAVDSSWPRLSTSPATAHELFSGELLSLFRVDGTAIWMELHRLPLGPTQPPQAAVSVAAPGPVAELVRLRPADAAVAQLMELQRSEQRWQAIVQNPFDYVVIIDREGVYQYVNHMKDNREEDIVGSHTLYDHMDAPYREGARQAIANTFATGQPSHFEAYSSYADNWFTSVVGAVVEDGEVRYASVLARICTEEKRATAALAESEAHFRALADQTPNVIFINLRGTLVYVNDHVEHLLGYPRDLVLSPEFDFRDTIVPEDRELVNANFQRHLAGEELPPYEYGALTADGRRLSMILSTRLIDYHGDTAILGVATDITEQKRVEKALRESNTQLQSAYDGLYHNRREELRLARLHAMGQMASGIAHDFNNRLMGIVGYGDLLREQLLETDGDRDSVELAELIITGATEAGAIANRLKEFYRHEEARSTFLPVDLHALVRRILSLTETHWRTQPMVNGVSVKVVTNLQPTPGILGIAGEIGTALTNLILNAVDAMPEGGTLSVSTVTPGDGMVRLAVRDTGIGMDNEVRERCLEPFFTTKKHTGSGFGLATTYGIMKRHGGLVEITSAVGEGTTISLCFPEPPKRRESERAKTDGAGSHRNARILLCDDELAIRRVLQRILQRHGYDVTAVADGIEGLNAIRAQRFDILLTDMAMPGYNGPELARLAKNHQPDLLVILLTGFGNLMTPANARLSGIDVLLSKPIGTDDLMIAINKLLDTGSVAPAPLDPKAPSP